MAPPPMVLLSGGLISFSCGRKVALQSILALRSILPCDAVELTKVEHRPEVNNCSGLRPWPAICRTPSSSHFFRRTTCETTLVLL